MAISTLAKTHNDDFSLLNIRPGSSVKGWTCGTNTLTIVAVVAGRRALRAKQLNKAGTVISHCLWPFSQLSTNTSTSTSGSTSIAQPQYKHHLNNNNKFDHINCLSTCYWSKSCCMPHLREGYPGTIHQHTLGQVLFGRPNRPRLHGFL